MKTMLSCIVGGLLATVPLSAAEQTWTGHISDSLCGAKHMAVEHGKKIMSDRECAQACAQKGAEYVLVADGKVYKLRNHDADLRANAGHGVNLTGDLNGDTIRVTKITMATAAK
jgi:hypothetical protein